MKTTLALLFMAAVAAAAQAPLTAVPGTVALYQFDEDGGVSVEDSSGNTHAATLTRAAWDTGIAGTGLFFANGSDWLAVPSLPMGPAWTLQCWVRFPLPPSSAGWRTLAQNTGGVHHVLVEDTGRLGVFDSNFLPCTNDFSVGAVTDGWHLLSAVGSGGKTHFYIDAELVGWAEAQVTGDINTVGNSSGGAQQFGQIDSLRIVGREMSAGEIADDAGGPVVTPEPSPTPSSSPLPSGASGGGGSGGCGQSATGAGALLVAVSLAVALLHSSDR